MVEISVGLPVAGTKLTVAEELPRVKSGRKYRRVFRCVCECGNERVVRYDHLRSGHSTSCGCDKSNVDYTIRPGYHGMEGTPEHGIWLGIKKRCFRKRDKAYRNYGGRGITMCERWKSSFKAFFEDMGPRPSEQHSIERTNNDGNYEPGNCIWATDFEQNRNRRDNVMLEFRGERMCSADWARRYGMSKGTLRARLESGLSVEEALTIPVRQWRKDEEFLATPILERDQAFHRDYARRNAKSQSKTP
jgi:hypothetical protein